MPANGAHRSMWTPYLLSALGTCARCCCFVASYQRPATVSPPQKTDKTRNKGHVRFFYDRNSQLVSASLNIIYLRLTLSILFLRAFSTSCFFSWYLSSKSLMVSSAIMFDLRQRPINCWGAWQQIIITSHHLYPFWLLIQFSYF